MVIQALFIFLIIELILISIYDFRFRKIKNYWHLINIVPFIAMAIFENIYVYRTHFIIPVATFAVGFLLYRFPIGNIKIMGGGDAKLITGLVLVMPSTFQIIFLEHLIIITILVASILILQKIAIRIKSILKFDFEGIIGPKFPYSPLILIAMVWTIVTEKIFI